jgi:hypothetical protein
MQLLPPRKDVINLVTRIQLTISFVQVAADRFPAARCQACTAGGGGASGRGGTGCGSWAHLCVRRWQWLEGVATARLGVLDNPLEGSTSTHPTGILCISCVTSCGCTRVSTWSWLTCLRRAGILPRSLPRLLRMFFTFSVA